MLGLQTVSPSSLHWPLLTLCKQGYYLSQVYPSCWPIGIYCGKQQHLDNANDIIQRDAPPMPPGAPAHAPRLEKRSNSGNSNVDLKSTVAIYVIGHRAANREERASSRSAGPEWECASRGGGSGGNVGRSPRAHHREGHRRARSTSYLSRTLRRQLFVMSNLFRAGVQS